MAKKKVAHRNDSSVSSLIVILLIVLILLSVFNLGVTLQAYTKSKFGSSALQQKSSGGEVSLTILPSPKDINSKEGEHYG